MNNKLKSRKMWAMICLHAGNVLLLMNGHLDSGGYVTVTTLLINGWLAANHMDKRISIDDKQN